jgi:hypothetical protein
MRCTLVFLLFLAFGALSAQEVVLGLKGNPQLHVQSPQMQAAAAVGVFEHYEYNLNTLTLPFFDDFSSDNIKVYSSDSAGKVSATVVQYAFSVGGNHPDTVAYSKDTTWRYQLDSTKIAPNSMLQIIQFNASQYPAISTDTIDAWPSYSIYGSDTTLLKKLTLSNNKYVFYFLKDDASLWTGRGVFVNANYPINPPSVGAATFDAINEMGKLYPNASSTQFVGDSLVSKPIDLSALSPTDNVYLSFYVESKGFGGDAPEEKDSLLLSFMDNSGAWRSVWGSVAKNTWATDSFFKFYVKVDLSIFFHKNFRFKFFNYASIEGFGSDGSNRDQWQLDYVQMDKNRFSNDAYGSDMAFVYPPKTLVNGFYAVPWNHFKSASNLMTGTSQALVRNISNVDASADFSVNIKEQANVLYTSAAAQIATVPSGLTQVYNENYGSFVYTSPENDTAVFDVQYTLNTALANNFKKNDTLSFTQVLSNCYAYDDGSAEAGYGFYYAGAEFAYKFPILQSKGDSLRGVKIYFNEVVGSGNYQIPFTLRVWEYSLGKPGALILESSEYMPDSIKGINKYLYYPFEEAIFVKDTICIGWKQTTNDYINVGLDLNTSNADKMFFYVVSSGTWSASHTAGSVMFEPVLGAPVVFPAAVLEQVAEAQIFPNPAKQTVFIHCAEKIQAFIMDIEGRVILQNEFQEGANSIDLSNNSEGLYIIKIVNADSGKIEFHKLVVQ